MARFTDIRGAQAAGLHISAARRNGLARKVRDGESPSPAREPRALPRLARNCIRIRRGDYSQIEEPKRLISSFVTFAAFC